MYIEPSIVKQITGGIMGVFAALGFVMAIYKHIFSEDADDSISEFFGTWFNYVANGIFIALAVGIGAYAFKTLLKTWVLNLPLVSSLLG